MEGLNDARTKLANCFSILLRYHGVFQQGKRGKASPAGLNQGSCGWDGSWRNEGGSVMLILNLVGVMNRLQSV